MKRRARGKIDWARLNYILLPDGKPDRDRVRRTRLVRGLSSFYGLYEALTEEGRVALLLTVVVAFTALDVRHSDAYVLFCILGSVTYASLVVSRLIRLTGVTLTVAAPRRVTVGEPLHFTISCRNDGPTARHGLVVRGPFLPWDGRWLTPRPTIPELGVGAGRAVMVDVAARFVRRGEHYLDGFTVAPLVPLGLALGRTVETAGVPFLAVPRVASVVELRTHLAKRHQPGGVPLASKSGESMDLLGVRPYRPGDLGRDLHARSWARTGVPVVREYQEEYFSRVGVVVDTDGDAADAATFEAALSLAAGVVAHLTRGEALIDLLVAGDRVHSLTVGRSLGFLDQVQDLLAVVEPGDGVDPAVLASRLSPYLGRLSSLFFIALAWNDARRAFVERVRRSGVGCSVLLVVGEGETTPAAADADSRVTRVSAAAIASGARLAL